MKEAILHIIAPATLGELVFVAIFLLGMAGLVVGAGGGPL